MTVLVLGVRLNFKILLFMLSFRRIVVASGTRWVNIRQLVWVVFVNPLIWRVPPVILLVVKRGPFRFRWCLAAGLVLFRRTVSRTLTPRSGPRVPRSP